jgi:hypothetical protein
MEHEKRASPELVRSGWGLEQWLKRMPSVEVVRPTHCPRCEAAGQPIGLPVGMHGHGVRSRQVRGPASPQGPALLREVKVRRYRCRTCGSTCTVAPWEVVTRRLYSVTAVVWALALWAVVGLGLGAVRQRVSPWATVGESTARRWRTVRHWLSAVQQGRLLKKVRPWAPGLTARQAAAHVVHVVAGYALPCAAAPPYYVLAFWGAARAA